MKPEELDADAQYDDAQDQQAEDGYNQWLDEHPDGTPDEYEVWNLMTETDRW